MCRFIAYHGDPILMEDVITSPSHSLIKQALHATESRSETNGDGFGIGWYGERDRPGVYREVHPAWSDENLISICQQVRSSLFFAHVRAATGTAVADHRYKGAKCVSLTLSRGGMTPRCFYETNPRLK